MNCPTTNNGFRQESQASGIGVSSYRRIGVNPTREFTNPSYKRYTHSHKRSPIKESGLQTPPTKDITPPTRDTHSGISNPPNRPLSEGRGLQGEVCKSSLTFSESGCAFRV